MNNLKKYDLVVVGGGTAGVAAAYIAAKNNLKTLINDVVYVVKT